MLKLLSWGYETPGLYWQKSGSKSHDGLQGQ